MPKCPGCNSEVMEGRKYCHMCGATIEPGASPSQETPSPVAERVPPTTEGYKQPIGQQITAQSYDPRADTRNKGWKLLVAAIAGLVVAAAVVLVLVFVVFKGNGNSPKATVEKYLTAIDEGRVNEAYDFLSGSIESSGQRDREQFQDWARGLEQTYESIKVLEEEVDNKEALVTVSVKSKSGALGTSPVRVAYGLIKKGENWKIEFFYDPDPGSIVDDALENLKKGDIDACWGSLHSESGEKQIMTKEEFGAEYVDKIKEELKSWQVVGTETENGYTIVYTKMVLMEGDSIKTEFRVAKEDGKWKLLGYSDEPGGNRLVSQSQTQGAEHVVITIQAVTGFESIKVYFSIQNIDRFMPVSGQAYLVDESGTTYRGTNEGSIGGVREGQTGECIRGFIVPRDMKEFALVQQFTIEPTHYNDAVAVFQIR